MRFLQCSPDLLTKTRLINNKDHQRVQSSRSGLFAWNNNILFDQTFCRYSWFLSVAGPFLFHLVKETCFKWVPVCFSNGEKVRKILIAFNNAKDCICVCYYKNVPVIIFIRLNIKEFAFCFYVKNSFSFSNNIKLDRNMFIASNSFLCCYNSFLYYFFVCHLLYFLLSCVIPRCGLQHTPMTISICQKIIKFHQEN